MAAFLSFLFSKPLRLLEITLGLFGYLPTTTAKTKGHGVIRVTLCFDRSTIAIIVYIVIIIFVFH